MDGVVRTRFRFRSADGEVEVLLEGVAEWVIDWRAKLELNDVGWLQRTIESGGDEGDDDEGVASGRVVVAKPLPGPPPDPSKVVTVRRTIGELDISEEVGKVGVHPSYSPKTAELREILDDYDEAPLPPAGSSSTEPVAEGWLRELMRIAVRRFGVMGLPSQLIVDVLHGRHDLDDDLVPGWLERQCGYGNLVRIYAGEDLGYGPEPAWLNAI